VRVALERSNTGAAASDFSDHSGLPLKERDYVPVSSLASYRVHTSLILRFWVSFSIANWVDPMGHEPILYHITTNR
jgi:hypothetical protein